MPMKLYILKRKELDWGLYNSMVVRAQSYAHARQLARDFADELEERCGQPGFWANQWVLTAHTTCKLLKTEGTAKVVHSDLCNP